MISFLTMFRLMLAIALFFAGLLVGGALFSKSIPRSVISPSHCGARCFEPRELLGLLASAGLAHAPDLIPRKAAESARCVGITHWAPEGRYQVVYFPKKDARNIMELEDGDMPYLLDCLVLARRHVAEAGFDHYRVVSNGPALQHVAYFHLHVIAR